MATKFAIDGPGDQLWRGTTCGVIGPFLITSERQIKKPQYLWIELDAAIVCILFSCETCK